MKPARNTCSDRSRTARSARLNVAAALACVLNQGAQGATLGSLHAFDGTDGWITADTMLAQGRDGNLYGTSTSGGVNGFGTAFRLSPDGAFTKLHDFDHYNDGNYPEGGLVLGKDGNLYGTTKQGGAYGDGTVFRMTPSGAVTTLHHFNRAAGEGANPVAPPTLGRDGYLYGTTERGGISDKYGNSNGTVYKIRPDENFTTLLSFFDGPKFPVLGTGPVAPLIQGSDGALYGTAKYGGQYSRGTVFKISMGGVASVLHQFHETYLGIHPDSPLVQGADGNLYGTARTGAAVTGGVIYRLTPTGGYTVLHEFIPNQRGYWPSGGLVLGSDGNLYGTTYGGGTHDRGIFFRVTPAGTFTRLASFDPVVNGGRARTPLLHTNGKIYGTARGGALGYGTVNCLDVGAPPFIAAIPNAAKAGRLIGLLGDVDGATEITFNGIPASFSGVDSTYRSVVLPAGAATGPIAVATPTGVRQTLTPFLQLPKLTGFIPASGPVGSTVILTGSGLTQTKTLRFGGRKIAGFVVDSDSQITTKVPAGAIDGRVSVTNDGGTVSTATAFTVTP